MNVVSPAGFWIRALAFVLDGILVTVAQASYGLAARLVFGADPDGAWELASTVSFFSVVFAATYTTVLHAAYGQTLGKLLVGVRVVASDGEPPAAGAAFLRWLGYVVSFMTLGLGFFMAGLRTDKRALHDLIAGTRVERVGRARRPSPRPDDAAASAPPPGGEPVAPVPPGASPPVA